MHTKKPTPCPLFGRKAREMLPPAESSGASQAVRASISSLIEISTAIVQFLQKLVPPLPRHSLICVTPCGVCASCPARIDLRDRAGGMPRLCTSRGGGAKCERQGPALFFAKAEGQANSSASAPAVTASNSSASAGRPAANASPSRKNWIPRSCALIRLPYLLSCVQRSIDTLT